MFPWVPWSAFRLLLSLTLCCWLSFFPGVPGSSCQGWPTLCCWLSVSLAGSWSSSRLPGGDRLFLLTHVDSLFLDHGLPASSAVVQVTDFVLWGSRLGHLGRLTRVTESDFALFWTAPSLALSPLERSLLFFSYFFPRTTFLYLKVLIFSLASRLQLPLLLSYLSQLLLIELPVPTSLERFLLMSYSVPWATSSVKPVPYLSSKYLFSSGIIAPLNQHFVLAIYPFFSWPAE